METPENVGKIVSINVETGDYEIGGDPVVTSRRLQAKQPDASIWSERVEYDAVYTTGPRLAPADLQGRRETFHQALLSSGLVRQIKAPCTAPVERRELGEAQGKPVSETIIEERR